MPTAPEILPTDDGLARAHDPRAAARDLGVPQRQLHAERHRLGVHAVRAADHRRPAMLARARRDRRRERVDVRRESGRRPARICSASAVSSTSDDVRPKCSQRADGPDLLGDGGRERDHVVLRGLLDLVDARDVERGALAQRRARRRPARRRRRPARRSPPARPRARSRTGAASLQMAPISGMRVARNHRVDPQPRRPTSGRPIVGPDDGRDQARRRGTARRATRCTSSADTRFDARAASRRA